MCDDVSSPPSAVELNTGYGELTPLQPPKIPPTIPKGNGETSDMRLVEFAWRPAEHVPDSVSSGDKKSKRKGGSCDGALTFSTLAAFRRRRASNGAPGIEGLRAFPPSSDNESLLS